MARAFLAWYRRYYLLVNLPVLFLISDYVAMRLDLVRFKANDLADAYTRLHADPPQDTPVLLLLGNSGIRQDVDEAQLEQVLGRPDHPVRVYNFGLSAARVDDTFELARQLRSQGLKPTAVVLGLNAFLIDDQVNPDSRFPWLHRTTPYLYFHRSILRELIKRVFRGGMERAGEFELGRTEGVQTAAQREFAVDSFLHEFEHRSMDYPLLDKVPELLSWLDTQGIPAYVVVLPISPDGAGRLTSFPSLIAAVRSKAPPGSLDLTERFPYTVFKDVGHVNAAGRKQVTAEIAAWLQARGVPLR
jgi:hypothetical protein